MTKTFSETYIPPKTDFTVVNDDFYTSLNKVFSGLSIMNKHEGHMQPKYIKCTYHLCRHHVLIRLCRNSLISTDSSKI
jgi:hypothetical protein